MLKRIGWGLLYIGLSGCAATGSNNTMNMQSDVSEIHYMGDAKLCYAFFTVEAMDEWYDYENIRRVRRLDCESYREEAEVQNKGKKINYEGASDVTFTKEGDATGSFLEQVVKGGKFKTTKQR